MRPPQANTWGTVALPGIHVITATRTTLLVGIVTTVAVVTVATATRTVTPMVETEIGEIVEAHLLLVVVDTLPTIGVAGATPAAHLLEEAVLHLVAEGGQESTTHQPLQLALLLLQHLPLNTHGGDHSTHQLWPTLSNHSRASAWIGSSGLFVACDFCVCQFLSALFYLFLPHFFLVLVVFFFSFCFSFHLTVSLYVLSLR